MFAKSRRRALKIEVTPKKKSRAASPAQEIVSTLFPDYFQFD
jgi:hypothetical protein